MFTWIIPLCHFLFLEELEIMPMKIVSLNCIMFFKFYFQTCAGKRWAAVARGLGAARKMTSASHTLKTIYANILLPYEQVHERPKKGSA